MTDLEITHRKSQTGYRLGDIRSDQFREKFKALFDTYVNMRVHGHHQGKAFRATFGEEFVVDENFVERAVHAVESASFKAIHEAIKRANVEDLWNPALALQALQEIANSPDTPKSVRVEALKESRLVAENHDMAARLMRNYRCAS
ncbi:hypothetical protein FX016_21740 [Cupriavidus gilardii]|nr:hypothetical protein FX016_21740 [Cupriavidus gilardii]